MQLRFLSDIQRIPRWDGEPFRSWRTRQANAARGMRPRAWSHLWIGKCMDWKRHLGRHPDLPAAHALRVQPPAWLQQRRARHRRRGDTLDGGHTQTRSAGGSPSRWEGIWAECLEDAPDRRTASTAEIERAIRVM